MLLLVSMDRTRSQRPGPSPILGSLGPPHQRRHKSHVSLRGPPGAHSVAGTPHEEVRDKGYGITVSSCSLSMRVFVRAKHIICTSNKQMSSCW